MAVRVLAVPKVAVIFSFLGVLAILHEQARVRAVPVGGDREDASAHINMHQFGVSRDGDSDRRNLRMIMMFRF